MAGIYIHIPFCKQKCNYCDFHFSTNLTHRKIVINAICKEIQQKKELLPNTEKIATIYFGGGTPSLLFEEELVQILDAIYKNYNLSSAIEFTLECNPDDVDAMKLKLFKKNGINRLSIGVQSFFDEDLKFFNRAHNQQQAQKSILLSQQDAGIENITIDLIYNSPLLTLKKWEENLDKFSALKIPHLSAYNLTVEPKTALYHLVKTKQTQLPPDEQAVLQFELLLEKTKQAGLIHYEISNFGRKGYFSQHNSNYWKGENYLGIGPSAHSFVKNKRSWNVSNNTKYTTAINKELPYFEEEFIDEITAYNEYLLTRLRTLWGVDIHYIKNTFSAEINSYFTEELAAYKNTNLIAISKNKLTLTPEGIFLADKIIFVLTGDNGDLNEYLNQLGNNALAFVAPKVDGENPTYNALIHPGMGLWSNNEQHIVFYNLKKDQLGLAREFMPKHGFISRVYESGNTSGSEYGEYIYRQVNNIAIKNFQDNFPNIIMNDKILETNITNVALGIPPSTIFIDSKYNHITQHALQTVTTKNLTVLPGTNLSAGQEVRLKPGTHIQAGADTRVFISNCEDYINNMRVNPFINQEQGRALTQQEINWMLNNAKTGLEQPTEVPTSLSLPPLPQPYHRQPNHSPIRAICRRQVRNCKCNGAGSVFAAHQCNHTNHQPCPTTQRHLFGKN